ncbi:MAG: Na+/H+ antiporter NhaC family protein [Actinomycetaceae bacterium]|nr:Na+/H+ antiporter NhaC family protein [Actinomycetaceae bacterium]
MNAVVVAVIVMLLLALLRVHVVIALFLGALVGGLLGGLGLDGTMVAFQEGLGAGAKIALSYALLGAFAMAVAHSGLPAMLANWLISKIEGEESSASARAVAVAKYGMIGGIVAMTIMSQNLIPVHIAFIPLLIPPLLSIMNKLQLDRRLITCCLTFGLVTTYMFLPLGFGKIFLKDILLANIDKAGVNVDNISVIHAMGIPALGMLCGLLIAIFFSYRKKRVYEDAAATATVWPEPSRFRLVVSVVAILSCFGIQLVMNLIGSQADALLVGALVGLGVFLLSGAIKVSEADDVFTQGMKMMALIGFIMITAQGFASVMVATKEIDPLVQAVAQMFAGNKGVAALAMLLVGLLVTMGIGSSFSTLPIIAAIYVPLCVSLGFSPLATVSIVGTAGALGDAGSPASDSTLGPTAGLNADGQHDHVRDSVIPTFLHFNLPLLVAGWIAAMVL